MVDKAMTAQIGFIYPTSPDNYQQPVLVYTSNDLPSKKVIYLSVGLVYLDPDSKYDAILDVYVDGNHVVKGNRSTLSTPPIKEPEKLRLNKQTAVFSFSTQPIPLPAEPSFVLIELKLLSPVNYRVISEASTWVQSMPSK